jgi:RNA-binding protein 25
MLKFLLLLQWTGDGLRNRNGEEQGRQRKSVGSEGRKDREVTAAGKSSLQATFNSGEKPTLDAKQLLATVPKTKKELFSHDVNWAIYDEVKQTYPPFPFYFST